MLRTLGTLGVVASIAGTVVADIPHQSLTVRTPLGALSDGGILEGAPFSEDFETLSLGALLGQGGWTGNDGQVVNSGVPSFGARSISLGVTNPTSGFISSPLFAHTFGTMSADINIPDAGASILSTWSLLTGDSNSGFLNTRVIFRSNGKIDVLQVDALGNPGSVGTTGVWIAGQTTRIGIETLQGGDLNIFQDGSLIFTGTDIVFANGFAGGFDQVFAQTIGIVGTTPPMLIDNFNLTIPTPTTLALFGLAGLAMRSRRRGVDGPTF